MRAYTRNMTQKATIFKRTGVNGFGEPQFAVAENILCRWEDKRQINYSAAGEEFISAAVVYTAKEVAIGDMLAKGEDQLIASASEVKAVETQINLRGRLSLKKAVL